MKIINVEVKLFRFEELSNESKTKAIHDHRFFMLGTMTTDDFVSGDPLYDTPEELAKTYDGEYENILYNDEVVIENILLNEYYFFVDGKIANTSFSCATKIEEFYYQGKTYIIN